MFCIAMSKKQSTRKIHHGHEAESITQNKPRRFLGIVKFLKVFENFKFF